MCYHDDNDNIEMFLTVVSMNQITVSLNICLCQLCLPGWSHNNSSEDVGDIVRTYSPIGAVYLFSIYRLDCN